jgi:hypothetical protein
LVPLLIDDTRILAVWVLLRAVEEDSITLGAGLLHQKVCAKEGLLWV